MKKFRRKTPWEAHEAEEAVQAESEETLPEDAEEIPAPAAEENPEPPATAAEVAALREALDALRTELAALRAEAEADAVNERNRAQSAGKLAPREGEEYLSPSEVRAMSREAVREQYDRILRSMKHWH